MSLEKENVPADFPYEDIVNLPHPVSKKYPPMSLHDRAAQFAPFAALTGYHDAIEETAEAAAGEAADETVPFEESI